MIRARGDSKRLGKRNVATKRRLWSPRAQLNLPVVLQARGDQSDVPAMIPSPDILLHELEELLPPPPSPRFITIKRTDSSAGSLDKASSEVRPKASAFEIA